MESDTHNTQCVYLPTDNVPRRVRHNTNTSVLNNDITFKYNPNII